MSPEAKLAAFVDDLLGRQENRVDPPLARTVQGIALIAEACIEAQKSSGDSAAILSKLREGVGGLDAGLPGVREDAALQGVVPLAERQRRVATAIIDYLHARGDDDLHWDYPFEDAKFRYEHATKKVYRRFYGEPEDEIRHDSELYTQARLSGRTITREEYEAD